MSNILQKRVTKIKLIFLLLNSYFILYRGYWHSKILAAHGQKIATFVNWFLFVGWIKIFLSLFIKTWVIESDQFLTVTKMLKKLSIYGIRNEWILSLHTKYHKIWPIRVKWRFWVLLIVKFAGFTNMVLLTYFNRSNKEIWKLSF